MELAETTPFEVGQCTVLPSETALPARVVSAAPPQSREGVSVSENAWFKHWAKKSISSPDLNSLTDHEERVWWRFLSVASSQEERWVVRLSVKLTLEALVYSCHSTNTKLKAALSRFEAMGMLTAIEDGWVVTNWEKHQETPEAKRKREQRERDKARDMSQDKSRDSHLQEDRGQRTDPSEPKGSSGGGRKRASRPRKVEVPVVPLTDEERAAVLSENADFDDAELVLGLALSHPNHLKYPENQLGYVRNWFKNERAWHPERIKGNGSNGTHAKGTGVAEKFAAYG